MAATDKVNILLVDDQPQKLLSYEAILAPLGENLLRAGSAREALDILLKSDIAVVLVDVVMPEMDGFEMARVVRGHPRFQSTPIIFVSAISTSDMERLRGYELGAVDYVCVPVVAEILRAKVTVFVDLHRKTRELQALNRELEQRVAERTADLERTLATLKEQSERLAEADRRKDEFLAMLAHELRNPLAPIRTAMDIMRVRPIADPALERSRDIVERQVAHMIKLLDDLLDVSRITRGKIRIAKEPMDVRDLMAQAIETSRPLIDGRKHRLTVRYPADTVRIEADPTRITQVLANLLNNAAKYTEPGGQISLLAERDGAEIVIRVRDSGMGIATDMLPRVFDLFAQAERSLHRSQGGLGVGLTLVRKLVEMHGGSVSAHSAGIGHGSEFVVRLPILVQPPAPQCDLASPSEVQNLRPSRLLIVDDHVGVAGSLTLLLRELGHDVHTVHSGQAAIEAARARRPDIVLLDIGLPDMDGYDVAQRIREQTRGNTPLLIAISGYGRDEDIDRSRKAGFNYHLVKPVSLASLEAAMSAVAPAAGALTR